MHPSGRYVLWDVKETRNGVEQCESALIYTHQVRYISIKQPSSFSGFEMADFRFHFQNPDSVLMK